MITVHAMISGRVQGVGYRAWTVDTAASLGIRGWVRNRKNGCVEAVFQGEDPALHQMVEKCHDGPLFARVSAVKTSETAGGDPVFSDFTGRSSL